MKKKYKEPTPEDLERGESTGIKRLDERSKKRLDKEFGREKEKEDVKPDKKVVKKDKDKKKKPVKSKKPREPVVAGGDCPWSSFRAMIDDLWTKKKKKLTFAEVNKYARKYFKGKKYDETQFSSSMRKRERHGCLAKRDLKRVKKK